jgi:hypothetical protein
MDTIFFLKSETLNLGSRQAASGSWQSAVSPPMASSILVHQPCWISYFWIQYDEPL